MGGAVLEECADLAVLDYTKAVRLDPKNKLTRKALSRLKSEFRSWR